MRALLLVAFFIGALIAGSGSAFCQDRVALIIGNSTYGQGPFAPLKNASNDAVLIGKTLKNLQFDVEILTNANEDQMEDAISRFGTRLTKAGENAVGFFYFAGHGIQSQGRHFMIPVDGRARTEQDVWSKAPRAGLVEEQMQMAGNAVNFIVLDACRSNNLPTSFRGFQPASAASTKAEGLLFGYATRPGEPAIDGKGVNSPYATALAKYLETPGLIAEQVFKKVAEAVRTETSNEQQPWIESGLTGADFCFADCRSTRSNRDELDDDAWEMAKEIGVADGYRIYLTRFPAGRHAEAARLKRDEFEKAKAGVVTAALNSQTATQPSFKDATQERVYFGYDQYSLNDDSRRVLQQQAVWLLAHPEAKIELQASTDERGSREYALALASRMADSVKAYLAALGVNSNRISIMSFGKDRPLNPGNSEEAWAQNRNVETVILN